jgi:hypothetical protein
MGDASHWQRIAMLRTSSTGRWMRLEKDYDATYFKGRAYSTVVRPLCDRYLSDIGHSFRSASMGGGFLIFQFYIVSLSLHFHLKFSTE